MRYGRHSSKAPRCRDARATYPRTRRAASMSACLVLLRMEVAAFHPHALRRATRLCGPVPRLGPSRTTAYSGGALPRIPLYGARTFLCPLARTATVWLASEARFYAIRDERRIRASRVAHPASQARQRSIGTRRRPVPALLAAATGGTAPCTAACGCGLTCLPQAAPRIAPPPARRPWNRPGDPAVEAPGCASCRTCSRS